MTTLILSAKITETNIVIDYHSPQELVSGGNIKDLPEHLSQPVALMAQIMEWFKQSAKKSRSQITININGKLLLTEKHNSR